MHVVFLALDHAQMAVAQDLSARYCPHDKLVFLTRLFASFAGFAVVGLAALLAAYRGRERSSSRTALYAFAVIVLMFAIGSAAFVLYGLSGCNGPPAEGLTWDWP
jgi:heme A synthase